MKVNSFKSTNHKIKVKWVLVAQEVMAGALVLKVVRKLDFGRVFSRVQLVEGDALKKCVKIKNHLSRKTDVFADFDCETYLRYYGVCVKPEYRKRGVVQTGAILWVILLKCGVVQVWGSSWWRVQCRWLGLVVYRWLWGCFPVGVYSSLLPSLEWR